MTSHQMGQPVAVTHVLRRCREYVPGGPDRHGHDRKWWHAEVSPANEHRGRESFPGIVIGKRTLADGTSHHHDFGAEFKATRRFPAYLVSYDLHRSPVLVLPEHLTPTGMLEAEPEQPSDVTATLFGVYDELLTAALALRAQADRLNETTVAANCTRWEESAEVLHQVRLARTTAQVVEEALTKWIDTAWREVGIRDAQELDGVGVIDVRRGKERKGWDHVGLGPAVIDANLEKVNGEIPDPFTVARWVLAAAAPSYWRTTVLKGLGIDPDEWCESKPGRVSVQITTHDHIGATA